jgi:hypothetical protein
MRVGARSNWTAYVQDLDQLRGVSCAWMVFSHVAIWDGVVGERFFLWHLDNVGRRMRSWGAAAYLYGLGYDAHPPAGVRATHEKLRGLEPRLDASG